MKLAFWLRSIFYFGCLDEYYNFFEDGIRGLYIKRTLLCHFHLLNFKIFFMIILYCYYIHHLHLHSFSIDLSSFITFIIPVIIWFDWLSSWGNESQIKKKKATVLKNEDLLPRLRTHLDNSFEIHQFIFVSNLDWPIWIEKQKSVNMSLKQWKGR